jgi:hypothetical protein
MANVELKVNQRQLTNLVKEFRDIPKEIEGKVERMVKEFAIDTRHDTISPPSFPVVTDTLRPSYTAQAKGLQGAVYSEVEYAPNVEFGFGQRPQPYLMPAYEKNSKRFFKALDILIKKVTR